MRCERARFAALLQGATHFAHEVALARARRSQDGAAVALQDVLNYMRVEGVLPLGWLAVHSPLSLSLARVFVAPR